MGRDKLRHWNTVPGYDHALPGRHFFQEAGQVRLGLIGAD